MEFKVRISDWEQAQVTQDGERHEQLTVTVWHGDQIYHRRHRVTSTQLAYVKNRCEYRKWVEDSEVCHAVAEVMAKLRAKGEEE